MAALLPSIVKDRLEHRARVLRVSWHKESESFLRMAREGSYLNGLDLWDEKLARLTRQLDAIGVAVARTQCHMRTPSYAVSVAPERVRKESEHA